MISELTTVPSSKPEGDHLALLRRRALDPIVHRHPSTDRQLVGAFGATTFWEMVGIRVRGHNAGILGALEFRRQDADPGSLARESLTAYLSSPRTLAAGTDPLNLSRVLALQTPAASESIPDFLSRLSADGLRNPLVIDRDLLSFAFDFRSHNPSIEKRRGTLRPVWETVALRTSEGHVLTGALQDLRLKLYRHQPFLTLVKAVQHTPERVIPQDTLVLHRSFVSMITVVDSKDAIDTWTVDSFALGAESANPCNLLHPSL